MNKKTIIYTGPELEAYIDHTENIVAIEANWQDPDNTEEWFCHLGKDLENLFIEAFHKRVYTEDKRWYVMSNPKTGEFRVHNVLYDFTLTFSIYCLNKDFDGREE